MATNWQRILTDNDKRYQSWTGNTYGTRCTTQDRWYIGNLDLNTSPAAASFDKDLLDISYYPFFCCAEDMEIVRIIGCCATNFSQNQYWAARFYLVNFDDLDTGADSITQIGTDMTWNGTLTDMGQLRQNVSVSAAEGDIIVHAQRFTAGLGSKYLYFSPTIMYYIDP